MKLAAGQRMERCEHGAIGRTWRLRREQTGDKVTGPCPRVPHFPTTHTHMLQRTSAKIVEVELRLVVIVFLMHQDVDRLEVKVADL